MSCLAHVLNPWCHDAGNFSLKHGLFFKNNRQSLQLLYCCPLFFCGDLEGFHRILFLFGIFCLIIEALGWQVKEKRMFHELVNNWHMCRARTIGRPNRKIVVLLHIIQLLKDMWVVKLCCNGSQILYQFLALWKCTTRSNNLRHTLPFWIT